MRVLLHLLLLDEARREERQRAAGVREDPADVRILLRRAAENQMRDGARAVSRIFDRARWNAWHYVAAAVRRQRMHIDHRLAAVEFRSEEQTSELQSHSFF